MKLFLKSMPLFGLLLASFSTFAVDLKIGKKIDGDKDNITDSLSIEVPVIYANERTGSINWDATVAMSSSNTKNGRIIIQNIGGRDSIVVVDDGAAGYFSLGVQGRKIILNDYIEAVVKADYSLRTGGSTMYSKYSKTTGAAYDPQGGLNVGIGANIIIGTGMVGRMGVVGATLEKNMESGEAIVKLNFGLRY